MLVIDMSMTVDRLRRLTIMFGIFGVCLILRAQNAAAVRSAQSIGIPYRGTPLEASRRYFWTVESWDKDGKAYPVSETASWETGLMSTAAWRGKWI